MIVLNSGGNPHLWSHVMTIRHIGKFFVRSYYPVLILAACVGIAGGVSSQIVSWSDRPEWRWVTWSGLVAFTLLTVIGWCKSSPPPAATPDAAGRRTSLGKSLVEDSTQGTRVTRFLSTYAEPVFTWLVAYPLFPLPILFFWLVSWGGLGDGFGFPDLVWYETWWFRFWSGVGVALLFGNLLFVRYLLDERRGSTPSQIFGERCSLFWFVNAKEGDDTDDAAGKEKIRRLGAFLCWIWPSTLAVFYLPKLLSKEWCALGEPMAMFLGLVVAVGATIGLVWAFEKWFRAWWQQNWLFKLLPGFNGPLKDQIPETDRHLHALAGMFTAIPAIFFALLMLEHAIAGAVWSPVWLVCLGVGLFTSLYGFVTFHFSGLQYVLTLLAIFIVVVCNTQHPDKMSFPGLKGYGRGEEWGIVNPDDPGVDKSDTGDIAVKKREKWKTKYESIKLLKTDDILKTFHHDKWMKGKPETDRPKQKPKLVIVATTGGGIQAAAWTAVVLEGLESELSKEKTGGAAFRDHIRLFTGASGGMQAAALYASDFETKKESANQQSDQLARDSLWPTVQTMLLHDLPGFFIPTKHVSDRGRTLEAAWEISTQRTDENGIRSSPLVKTFADLKAKEATCDRPSLIFAPMLVEDCRRVVISNLEMSWFTNADGSNLNRPIIAMPEVPIDRLSVPAIEFWKLFPHAYNGTEAYPAFKLATAARMSATFPFVGPAVSLPTDPTRRVVDAGYFDNFGINVAALWLYRNKAAIREHTSGVVIVEIRAYPRRDEKLNFATKSQSREELISWAMSELSTPAEAVINLYSRSAYFRNDQLLDVLDKEFNTGSVGIAAVNGSVTFAATPPESKFFTTVVFECNQPAALSWTLPKRDAQTIRNRFYETGNNKGNLDKKLLHADIAYQVQSLRKWFGTGGTR